VSRCTKLVSIFLFLTVTFDVVLRNVGRICKYFEFTLRHWIAIACYAFGQVAIVTFLWSIQTRTENLFGWYQPDVQSDFVIRKHVFVVKTVLVDGNTAFPRQSESEGGLVLYVKKRTGWCVGSKYRSGSAISIQKGFLVPTELQK